MPETKLDLSLEMMNDADRLSSMLEEIESGLEEEFKLEHSVCVNDHRVGYGKVDGKWCLWYQANNELKAIAVCSAKVSIKALAAVAIPQLLNELEVERRRLAEQMQIAIAALESMKPLPPAIRKWVNL